MSAKHPHFKRHHLLLAALGLLAAVLALGTHGIGVKELPKEREAPMPITGPAGWREDPTTLREASPP